jgi:hypothetical protein
VFKKDRTFATNTLFYNILSTVPFKVVPSTGDTPFPTFLPLLECFLERTFCDDAQFSYRIFLNLPYGLEMTSFQRGFKFEKQDKVCWGLNPENRVDGAHYAYKLVLRKRRVKKRTNFRYKDFIAHFTIF